MFGLNFDGCKTLLEAIWQLLRCFVILTVSMQTPDRHMTGAATPVSVTDDLYTFNVY